MTDQTSITVDYIADLACPWCYIGLKRLDAARRLRPAAMVGIRWRPFMLNPHLPPAGMDRAQYLRAKFGGEVAAARIYQRLEEVGRAEGIPFAFARMTRTPNTVEAHRLILFASEHGPAEPLIERLFQATFVEGRDTGDPRVLAEEAATVGLERDAVERFLAGRSLTDEVTAAHQTAEWQGVRGVPVFVFSGTHAISGAQPPEVLAGLIDVATAERGTPQGRQAS